MMQMAASLSSQKPLAGQSPVPIGSSDRAVEVSFSQMPGSDVVRIRTGHGNPCVSFIDTRMDFGSVVAQC